jgi:hypothetical protein
MAQHILRRDQCAVSVWPEETPVAGSLGSNRVVMDVGSFRCLQSNYFTNFNPQALSAGHVRVHMSHFFL